MQTKREKQLAALNRRKVELQKWQDRTSPEFTEWIGVWGEMPDSFYKAKITRAEQDIKNLSKKLGLA